MCVRHAGSLSDTNLMTLQYVRTVLVYMYMHKATRYCSHSRLACYVKVLHAVFSSPTHRLELAAHHHIALIFRSSSSATIGQGARKGHTLPQRPAPAILHTQQYIQRSRVEGY